MEMLMNIACAVVKRQDERLLPTLRYLPIARVGTTSQPQELDHDLEVTTPATLDPYCEGPAKAELDERRFLLEMGVGGDVDEGDRGRGQQPSFPQRIEVVGVWLRLRERVVLGKLGGNADGMRIADVEDAS
jgi:hypothetical protein